MPEVTGTVKAKSQYGIKLDALGDEWANWSKPEYRGDPFDSDVVAGDRVRVDYNTSEAGKNFISVIERLSSPKAAGSRPIRIGEQDADTNRSIRRQTALKAAVELAKGMPIEGEGWQKTVGRVVYAFNEFAAAIEVSEEPDSEEPFE